MAQNDLSIRDWQHTKDHDSDMEESITSGDQSRSPLSLASETEPPRQGCSNVLGTPIHHPRFTSHREKLGCDSTSETLVRPIPIHATLEQTENRPDLDTTSDQETSSSNNQDGGSRPKRELSSDKLNILSYKYQPSAPGPSRAKRIRFMSFDEILTTAKQSDSHYVSPSFTLESAEELDFQLGEELKSTALDEKGEGTIGGHSFTNLTSTMALSAMTSPRVSPVCVPLLTPPQSPRQSIEIVEWPSNLVIDSALMSVATDARPLSPASLTGERDTIMETTGEATIGDTDCTLTKRLSFITVGSS